MNPTKEAFCLLDLLNEVKTVSSAIVEFQLENAKDLKDVAVKRLGGVMSKALYLMFENGYRELRKISSVKYLQRTYNKCRNYEKKRKRDDPMYVLKS